MKLSIIIPTQCCPNVDRSMFNKPLTYGTSITIWLGADLNQVSRFCNSARQSLVRSHDAHWQIGLCAGDGTPAAHNIRDLGMKFRLCGFITSELFTDEQAAAMYEADFRWILVGFESGHPRILENVQKKATRDENIRCMEIARHHNLKVKALMALGHPGESEETVQATRNWLFDFRQDDFDATVITTCPGRPYFDDAVETAPGWTYACPKPLYRLHCVEVDYRKATEFYKGAPGNSAAFIYTDAVTSTQLVDYRDWLETDIRHTLSIPFNSANPGLHYEHSMGQKASPLPSSGSRADQPHARLTEPFESSHLENRWIRNIPSCP